jgi:hypothetical protein
MQHSQQDALTAQIARWSKRPSHRRYCRRTECRAHQSDRCGTLLADASLLAKSVVVLFLAFRYITTKCGSTTSALLSLPHGMKYRCHGLEDRSDAPAMNYGEPICHLMLLFSRLPGSLRSRACLDPFLRRSRCVNLCLRFWSCCCGNPTGSHPALQVQKSRCTELIGIATSLAMVEPHLQRCECWG